MPATGFVIDFVLELVVMLNGRINRRKQPDEVIRSLKACRACQSSHCDLDILDSRPA